MSKIDYNPITTQKFRDFLELAQTAVITEEDGSQHSLTFGQTLYSVLRKIEKPNSVGWLTQVTDEEFYKAIEKAYKEEITEQQ